MVSSLPETCDFYSPETILIATVVSVRGSLPRLAAIQCTRNTVAVVFGNTLATLKFGIGRELIITGPSSKTPQSFWSNRVVRKTSGDKKKKKNEKRASFVSRLRFRSFRFRPNRRQTPPNIHEQRDSVDLEYFRG